MKFLKLNKKKTSLAIILASNLLYMFSCSQSSPLFTYSPEEKSITYNGTKIEFSKLKAEDIEKLNNYISKNITPNALSSTSPMASPMPPAPSSAPSASASSGGGSSSDSAPIPSHLDYSPPSYSTSYPYPTQTYAPMLPGMISPFFSSFEEYVIKDITEAKIAGYSGSFNDCIKNVVNPIIRNLATDSRFISMSGITGPDGKIKKNDSLGGIQNFSYIPVAPYITNDAYNWQFTFASNSKKEVYSILVSPNETLILKQKWGLKEIILDNIKIDSTEAIKILKNAIKDRTPQPYDAPIPNYMPTATPSYAPSPYYSDYSSPIPSAYPSDSPSYAPSPYYTGYPSAEPYYDVPEPIYDFSDNIKVTYSLEEEKGELFWSMTFYYDSNFDGYSPNYWYDQGYARINANTGKIISLNRIQKHKSYPSPTPYSTYNPDYSPTPYYSPSYVPSTSTPSPVATAQP